MDLNTVSSASQVASVAVSLAVSVWALAKRLEKRHNDSLTQLLRLSDKLDFIEKQFGPNGGGLRQAVNELTDKVDHIQTRQEELGDKLYELSGKFEQHDKQAK
jgi:hypothetical protein